MDLPSSPRDRKPAFLLRHGTRQRVVIDSVSGRVDSCVGRAQFIELGNRWRKKKKISPTENSRRENRIMNPCRM